MLTTQSARQPSSTKASRDVAIATATYRPAADRRGSRSSAGRSGVSKTKESGRPAPYMPATRLFDPSTLTGTAPLRGRVPGGRVRSRP
jgi:hypothetical protein